MNVRALMNPNVKCAGMDASVAEVIAIMEKNDCGTVPIVNAQNKSALLPTGTSVSRWGLARSRRPGSRSWK
jgi:CBS domain-containing protein